MLKNTLATLDAVSKLSRRLGIAHEALLGLRHAAELSGLSAHGGKAIVFNGTRDFPLAAPGAGRHRRNLAINDQKT